MQKKCKGCYKLFITSNKRKMFCEKVCRYRFNAKKTYLRIKDDPKYKEDMRKRVKAWIENNRQHFNEMCLRNYYKRREKYANAPTAV